MSRAAKKVKAMESETINEAVNTNEGVEVSTIEVVDEVAKDAHGRKTAVNITMEELETLGLKNKSQVIRYLNGENFAPSAIARFLGVRYQHVRNVLSTPLKRV